MNKIIKRILLGLIVWAVPFVASVIVWDTQTGFPKIGMDWFTALMTFAGTIGFAIAAYLYFREIKKNTVKEGWTTGITWYAELLILDYLILVLAFGMTFADYSSMFLTYLNVVVLSAFVGYMLKR